MKKSRIFASIAFAGLMTIVFSCVKDPETKTTTTPVTPGTGNPSGPIKTSFVEEFDTVNSLPSKGWVFKNNSHPIGSQGWRQGRYESGAMVQYKFLGPVPYIGFPAKSASASPTDFISVDVSAVNDAGDISAWLISPQITMTNGDKIIFWTRAADDSFYPVYTKDRMQVRANYVDGTANVGGSPVDTGSFSRLLLDINPNYIYNDGSGNPGGVSGYPRQWTKMTVTVSGIPGTGTVEKGRFAFRYLGMDAGLAGGTSGSNYPTIIGIDSLAYVK
jgi:hypothetical protein